MNICTLTEAAKEQISQLCKDNNAWGVSLNVKGGGCAGFEYEWGLVELAEDVNDGDEIIEANEGNLVIGVQSVYFLVESNIDYKKDLMGAMFDIQNPNARSSCGCGVSVNFDMDSIPQYIG